MSFLLDLTDVETSEKKTAMPPGRYTVFCVESELKDAKSGGGKYISCKFEVMQPEKHKGRVVFENFTVANANPKAVAVGKERLKNLMQAAGKDDFKIRSPDQLCGYVADVMLMIGERGYNEIRYFFSDNTDDSFEAVESAVGKPTKAPEKKASKTAPAWG